MAMFGWVASKVSPAPAIKPRKIGEILPISKSRLHHSVILTTSSLSGLWRCGTAPLAVQFTHPKAGLMRDGGRIEDLWHVSNLATTSSAIRGPSAMMLSTAIVLPDAYLRERLFSERSCLCARSECPRFCVRHFSRWPREPCRAHRYHCAIEAYRFCRQRRSDRSRGPV